MALVKMWYVPCHFFSFINYVHAHYIYTNIELGFETFVTENKFKNKWKFLISIVIHLMWILWTSTCIFNDAKPIEMINYVVWKIKIQNIALASTSALGSFGYMTLKIIL
jgi:hypothetical protein